MTSLDKLLRIAGALQSGTRDRARLLWLARPDLAEVLASRQAGMSPGLTLEAVRHLTKRLLDADNRVAAFRVAAESLYAAIEPQSIAFVLMQAESGDLLPVITIGQTTRVADGLRSLPVTAMAATQGASNDNLTIRYVPVTVARNERLYLGIAYDANARFDSCCDLLLETLAAALEVRLRKKGHPHLE